MTRLEEELRAALQPQDPPAGFADRVLARAQREPERNTWSQFTSWLSIPPMRWATAFVVLAVLVSGVGLHMEERRRAEGEAAKRQVMLALRITGEKWKVAAKEIGGSTNGREDQSQRNMENSE